MPTLDDLVLTVAAADLPTYADVAREHHVSQSTVSRAVQRVEAAVGRPLFRRDGRLAVVEESEASTIAGLRSIRDQWAALTRTPVGPESLRTLSIFCTVTASQAIVPELLRSFRTAHPSVHLDLRTGPASAALDAALRGDVDAAIAPLPRALPRSLVSVEVASTPLRAVAATDHPLPKAGWDDAHVIVPRQGLTRELVDRWAKKALRERFTVQEAESHEEVVALAALGSGIGIVPGLVVEASALLPRLQPIEPPLPFPVMRIALCARRRAISRAPLQQLWEMLDAQRRA